MRRRSCKKKDIFFLVAIVVMAVVYSVPSDIEMAEYYYASYRPKDAENIIVKDKEGSDLDTARALRNYLDSMLYQGKVKESLPIIEKLVKLKPRNIEYWKKYRSILVQLGRSAEAIQLDEKLIALGLVASNEKNLRNLAHDYEWAGDYENAIRVYEMLRARELLNPEDVRKMLSSYLVTKKYDEAELLVMDSLRRGVIEQSMLVDMYRNFLDEKSYSKAFQYATLYLGLPLRVAKSSWENSEYMSYLTTALIRSEKGLLSEFVEQYILQNKKEFAMQLLLKLADADSIDLDQALDFVEQLILKKEWNGFYVILEKLDKKSILNEREWRKIARRLMWSGDTDKASVILNALLQKTSAYKALDDLRKKTSSIIRFNFIQIAEVFQNILWSQAFALEKNSASRLETYKLLIEVHDSKSETSQSAESLNNLILEIESGQINVPDSELDSLRVKLAERYSWLSKHNECLESLRKIPLARLSDKAKALKAMSLYDLSRFDEAQLMLESISDTGSNELDESTQKRLNEIEIDLSARNIAMRDDQLQNKKIVGLDQNKQIDNLSFYDSVYDLLNLNQNQFWIRPGFFATHGFTVDQIELHIERKTKLRNVSLFFEHEQNVFMEMHETSWKPMIGSRWMLTSKEIETKIGYQGGGSAIRPQFELSVRASNDWIGYYSLQATLAKSVIGATSFRNEGVSETQLQAYVDKRLNSWVQLSISDLMRQTNYKNVWNQGKGNEVTSKLYLGNEMSRFKLGPWLHLTRWKSQNEILNPIFLRRNSMLGIFTQLDIGGGSWKAIHAKIISGWAYDFDLIEKKSDNVFVELLVEKAWGRKFATRLEYAFYTAKFKQAFNETVHIGGVNALWSL